MAAMEGGVATLALASGAAAITYTLQAPAQNGGHIVAQKTIYGGSYNLPAHTLPNFGISADFTDIHDHAAVESAIRPNTRAIYIETLGNPNHEFYKRYFPNGGASIFTFEIEGGQAEAFLFIDSLRLFSLLANVADSKSPDIHPASTTHSQLTEAEQAEQGISPQHRPTLRRHRKHPGYSGGFRTGIKRCLTEKT